MKLRDALALALDDLLPPTLDQEMIEYAAFELDRFVRNFTAVAVTDVHSMLKYEDMTHDQAVDCAIEAAEETL